ncbi:MAG: NADH-quinone oxidoreductase subunit J [Bdellovibrionales bacterium]|nr:NADH-quinone oxidoreductase subunit J [Bdellovibrionales bacterium]
MDSLIFYFLSSVLIFSALRVVTHKNPVYGALYLACALVALAGIFFLLEAHFIAGVQLVVYAGAVIVLFVMVLMLFDLKAEKQLWKISPFRWASVAFVAGLTLGVTLLEGLLGSSSIGDLGFFSAKHIARLLFTKYVLAFEVLGVLLILIAVGVVALTRLEREDD